MFWVGLQLYERPKQIVFASDEVQLTRYNKAEYCWFSFEAADPAFRFFHRMVEQQGEQHD